MAVEPNCGGHWLPHQELFQRSGEMNSLVRLGSGEKEGEELETINVKNYIHTPN